ncbi:MAG: undecaprenyl-diphosphatase UppP [Myxococcales bacterium]|nr:undecaprenyl-diphosphatase UppP [Myxococcales bacterium]
MPIWFAIVLGAVQGLTEFLPVSSTAHLRLAPALLGQHDPGAAFTAVLQLGTLAAVIIYFARDLFIDLPRAFVRDRASPQGRLPIYLVAGTVPIVVVGLATRHLVEGDARSLWVIATTLAVVGVLMAWVDARSTGRRTMDQLALRDALLIGGAQALALCPGVSRSGATIIAALLVGLRRTDAARFSFLLGIPAVAGAGILESRKAVADLGADAWRPLTVALVVAGVTGYATIAWLLKFLGSHRLVGFAAYRVLIAAVVVGLLLAGTVTPFEGV